MIEQRAKLKRSDENILAAFLHDGSTIAVCEACVDKFTLFSGSDEMIARETEPR